MIDKQGELKMSSREEKEIDRGITMSFFKLYFFMPLIWFRGWTYSMKRALYEGGDKEKALLTCYLMLSIGVILYILSPLFLRNPSLLINSHLHRTYTSGVGIFPFLLGIIKLIFRKEDATLTFITRKWVAETYPEWVRLAGSRQKVEEVLTYEYSIKITIISGVILSLVGALFTTVAFIC